MKVNRKKFLDAINYIQEVNHEDLRHLDLSEFFDCILIDEITDWRFTGLNNRDFILGYSNKWEKEE